ncbi:UNVERIFIED_CONTAM: hypothetical protein FKN15_027390 [Acipenser sinensis]
MVIVIDGIDCIDGIDSADYVSGGEMFTHLYQRDHFTEEEVRVYIGETILALEHLHKGYSYVAPSILFNRNAVMGDFLDGQLSSERPGNSNVARSAMLKVWSLEPSLEPRTQASLEPDV